MTPIVVGLCNSKMKQRYANGLPKRNSTVFWLNKWIEDWGFEAMAFTNLSGNPDWDGKQPDNVLLQETLDAHKPIIALGAAVEKHLKKMGYDCVRLPHPSGANLQMNDKVWVAEQVDKAKEVIDDALHLH